MNMELGLERFHEISQERTKFKDARKSMLIVEDDLSIQPVLERMIRKINPNVIIDWTTTAEEAFGLLTRAQRQRDYTSYLSGRGHNPHYEVVLSDIQLAGKKSGMDLVAECYVKQISANFVLTSGNSKFRSKFPFLPKPLRYRDVEFCIGPYLRDTTPQQLVHFFSPTQDSFPGPPISLDRQFEWFLLVISAAIIALFLPQLVLEFQHLPFVPFQKTQVELKK